MLFSSSYRVWPCKMTSVRLWAAAVCIESVEMLSILVDGRLMQAARTVCLKHVQCVEDDDFMAAFDKMISETLQVIHDAHVTCS